jgi:hypothetical protein
MARPTMATNAESASGPLQGKVLLIPPLLLGAKCLLRCSRDVGCFFGSLKQHAVFAQLQHLMQALLGSKLCTMNKHTTSRPVHSSVDLEASICATFELLIIHAMLNHASPESSVS